MVADCTFGSGLARGGLLLLEAGPRIAESESIRMTLQPGLPRIRPCLDCDQTAIIDMVLRIQNDEYQVGLTLKDQPDLNHIDAHYRDQGGAFWVAEVSGAVVGCIGLMRLSPDIGVLKKFFVERSFRGPRERCLVITLLDPARIRRQQQSQGNRAGHPFGGDAVPCVLSPRGFSSHPPRRPSGALRVSRPGLAAVHADSRHRGWDSTGLTSYLPPSSACVDDDPFVNYH